jgi:DNA-binding LacI/PurR family transcriptional regulator
VETQTSRKSPTSVIVGFDDMRSAQYVRLRLTTIRSPVPTSIRSDKPE